MAKKAKKAPLRVSGASPTKKTAKSGRQPCCEVQHGANHVAQTSRINRIVGQIQGIGRMIESRRYCPEILVQTRAAVSAIRALESAILDEHLHHCVKEAFTVSEPQQAEKIIKELIELYGSRN